MRRLSVVLFPGFELLDVFGPLEMFGLLPDDFELTLLGPGTGPVASAQGPAAVADHAWPDAPSADVVLVPGGIGTRSLVANETFLAWLHAYADAAEVVASVCTGAGVLAAAGLLGGRRATSNKAAFGWVRTQGESVTWVPQARWVQDGNRWTSAGVAAGIDMSLALIAHLHDAETATRVANEAEYDWHTDASWDPFAAKHGLTN